MRVGHWVIASDNNEYVKKFQNLLLHMIENWKSIQESDFPQACENFPIHKHFTN